MTYNIPTTEYREVEAKLRGAVLRDVHTPAISRLYAKLEQPVASPYASLFQKRILGMLMAVPMVAAALALFVSFGNSGSGVYLAHNDTILEQASAKNIMNNINALEQLSE